MKRRRETAVRFATDAGSPGAGSAGAAGAAGAAARTSPSRIKMIAYEEGDEEDEADEEDEGADEVDEDMAALEERIEKRISAALEEHRKEMVSRSCVRALRHRYYEWIDTLSADQLLC